MIAKILESAFYIFGYGTFLIVACEIDVKAKKAYYAMMIPFLMVLAIVIILALYTVWR